MTINRFLECVEATYGDYKSSWIKDQVEKYLKAEWNYQSLLQKLYSCLIRHYSITYEKTPGIAIFEEVDREYKIRQWTAGRLMIPECDRRKKLPEPEEVEDFSEEINRMISEYKEKHQDVMSRVRKGIIE